MLAAIQFRIAKEYLMVVSFFNNKVRVFENTMLWRMFAPKKEEVTGGWRRMHTKELHDLYSSLSVAKVMKTRRMRLVVHASYMGTIRNAYRMLV
jgi:hypothetical protein